MRRLRLREVKGFAQERHGQIFGISSDLRPGSLLLCPGHLLDCRVTDRGDWPGCLKAPLVGGQEAELQSFSHNTAAL